MPVVVPVVGAAACHLASRQLPGPDSYRQATTSFMPQMRYTLILQLRWAHERSRQRRCRIAPTPRSVKCPPQLPPQYWYGHHQRHLQSPYLNHQPIQTGTNRQETSSSPANSRASSELTQPSSTTPADTSGSHAQDTFDAPPDEVVCPTPRPVHAVCRTRGQMVSEALTERNVQR